MQVLNKTKYISDYTRVYNFFPDSSSFVVQSSRRNGYFQRLYFEHQYTISVGGQSFFYTFTYNDNSIPTYLGKPCFSYADIRHITNGALSKFLLRNYGSRLRYFCACESGEGKGKRGLGNNPHYHFIFFVQPANNPKYEFKAITPLIFYFELQKLWQGRSGYVPFKSAKFGIVKPGRNLGVVDASDCMSYVGKYVIKDVDEFSREIDIKEYWLNDTLKNGLSEDVLNYYCQWYSCLPGYFDSSDYREVFMLDSFDSWKQQFVGKKVIGNLLERWIKQYVFINRPDAWINLKDWFVQSYCPQYAAWRLQEYRNYYGPKVRCSKSLGEYGLSQIGDKLNPSFKLATSSGFTVQSPCLYYIRKLYYDVVKCPLTGNPLYCLNEDGKALKLHRLPKLIDDSFCSTVTNVHTVIDNSLYDFIDYKSDTFNSRFTPDFAYPDKLVFNSPKSIGIAYSALKTLVSRSDFMDVVYRYTVFKYVYQFRYFNAENYEISLDSTCQESDYLKDFALFLKYDLHFVDYDSEMIYRLHSYVYRGIPIVSFLEHPAFSPFKDDFALLAAVDDYIHYSSSESKKQQFRKRAESQQSLNAVMYNFNY